MESIKKLLECIMTGKDYSDAFKTVMMEKIKSLLESKKVQVAQDIFSEEVEELDELSKETLGSYIKKSSHDVAKLGAVTRHYGEKSEREKNAGDFVNARKSGEMADKVFEKSWKRRQGMAKAVDRLVKKEEVDLDEEVLDVATTYKRIAVKHLKDMSAPGATQKQKDYAKKMHQRALEASKMDNHTDALDHYRGIKEEVELDERKLTDAEMKKREEIVKSMKKKKDEFEDRYGERAKEVMYATATKVAKGMSDSVEEHGDTLEEKFETSRVNYKEGENPKDAKSSAKRYSDVAAAMFKAKRERSVAKSSNVMNASYETEEEMLEALTGAQHELDADKDGKIEASDLEHLRVKKTVAKAMDKHIKAYNEGSMDADTLGSKCVAAHKMVAKEHGIPMKDAIKHVNDHVEANIKD